MSTQHQIPIEIVHLGEGGYHIFCTVQIQGRSIHALIDTGANKSVLSTQLASELEGLEEHELEDNLTSGIGKEEVETSFVILDEMLIGEIKITNQLFGLIDLDHVDDMYRQMEIEPFEMIIGGDILVTHEAVINYGASVLTLSSNGDG